ncbi:MAG: TonB C-terminal domain-containing protein [Desulfocapsa sp.]|nr:TonB C-terminal domain-containing protein [Desulfocapsa sp.]
MATEYHITPAAVGWKLPFNLALLLHVLLISSAILLPQFFHRKPILPDIYTVDLVNIAEPLPTASSPVPPPPSQTEPAVKIDKPAVIKESKAIAIDKPAPESIPIEPVKAISIKPLKRKLKKKLPPDTSAQDAEKRQAAEQKRQQQLLEQRRQQLLQEAQRQQAIADAEAKVAAKEALNALKQSLRADAVVNSARKNQGGSAVARGRGTSNSLEAQYFSSIFSHLHQYWSLPDIKPWSPDTTAIVVVTITKNGTIIKHEFERYSGDKVFDRFVSRTIEDANPLPAIPPALKKNQYTIGLRFRPGGIQ